MSSDKKPQQTRQEKPVTTENLTKFTRKEILMMLNSCDREKGIQLQHCDLSELDLRHIDFTKANLTGSNLSKARLDGAILVSAELKYACFRNASMVKADLKKVKTKKKS